METINYVAMENSYQVAHDKSPRFAHVVVEMPPGPMIKYLAYCGDIYFSVEIGVGHSSRSGS